MNILSLVLALVIGGVPVATPEISDETPVRHSSSSSDGCITAERILKPILSWSVLKTELVLKDGTLLLTINVHNPLNKKTPESVDAKFVLSTDPKAPADTRKYNLMFATYYNEKAIVNFKRVYAVQEVKVKNKVKKLSMETSCFDRNVVPVIKFETQESK